MSRPEPEALFEIAISTGQFEAALALLYRQARSIPRWHPGRYLTLWQLRPLAAELADLRARQDEYRASKEGRPLRVLEGGRSRTRRDRRRRTH